MALLILDLDETLIFGTEAGLATPPDFEISRFQVYKRPFLDEFLRICAARFDLAVWSTASEHYVISVARQVFQDRYELKFIWDYARCIYTRDEENGEYFFLKNLDRVAELGYPLEQVLIVDDTPLKVRDHHENAILVAPFFGDAGDLELQRLGEFLQAIQDCDDLRTVVKDGWR